MAQRLDVIAHRGARRTHPENTLAAFEAAARAGADGIEFDVQLSGDGVPVVMHDATVDRTTDGAGRVDELTAADLGRLDAGSWFSSEFRSEAVPTLDAVLDWAHTNTLTLHIELKDGPTMRGDGLANAVTETLERADLSHRAVLSSYNHARLVEARAREPQLRTAILYDFGLYEPWDYVRSLGASAIHCRWDWTDASLVQRARAHAIAVRAFGADDEHALHAMLHGAGAGVITPEPELALGIRARVRDAAREA